MTTGIPARIGRYEIIGRLGGGGMGVVYKAHDPQIGRDVAIKQIREELDSQELRDRLLREVRATGRLRHPNIVSTFDIGDHDGFRSSSWSSSRAGRSIRSSRRTVA